MDLASSDGRRKAELISLGRVRVPRELLTGYRLSRSTAGPGAGAAAIALAWSGDDGREHRVKLPLARGDDDRAGLELVTSARGDLELRRSDGTLVVTGVRLLPIVMHAPDHAFINVDGECVYDCAFCTTPLLDPRRRHDRSVERWVELVVEAHTTRPFPSLAITSVASPDHEGLMGTYEGIIRGVLGSLPHLVIGVEPPIESLDDVRRLWEVGATEIKINIQSPDRAILSRVCPGWDIHRQCSYLEEAVRVFGRGKVTTNILIGLGEEDALVEEAIDRLASMGVVASVRAVRVGDLNRGRLEEALGHPVIPVDPERHLRLAGALSDALQRHSLEAGAFESMCHRCGCCDLEPGVDV